ncbi:MAG: vWA domain-containing protein [Gammaproteobacteria bacterium]
MNELLWLQPDWLWLAPVFALAPVWLKRLGWRLDWTGFRAEGLKLRLPAVALSVDAGKHAKHTDSQNRQRERIAGTILGLALALICIAMAQPYRQGAALVSEAESEPVDAWLLVSTSVSMVLKDYQIDGRPVDRMSMVRQSLERFAEGYKGRRIGLSILGHPPAIWLPPTQDRQLLLHHLKGLQSTLGGRYSALGDALVQLAEAQRKASDDAERIVIVFTDAGLEVGEFSPEQGFQQARDAGLTVYCIAFGGTALKADSQSGGLLYQPADIAALEKLARISNGRVFHATDAAVVDDALDSIQAKHRRPVEPPPELHLRTPYYPLPLGAGLMLIAVLPWLMRR